MRQISFVVLITLIVVSLTGGNSLVMAQNTTQKKPDKTEEKLTSDRMDNYQCLEYCAVVRQSCEGLAIIQPDVKISRIGSKENNLWSRECQKIHNGCMDKCDIDEKSVHWKRSKIAKSKSKKN